jgi:hypothetical protein
LSCQKGVLLMKVSLSNIGYRTAEFGKVSEYRYRIQAMKYRNIGYRIVKKVSGAQLWYLEFYSLGVGRAQPIDQQRQGHRAFSVIVLPYHLQSLL